MGAMGAMGAMGPIRGDAKMVSWLESQNLDALAQSIRHDFLKSHIQAGFVGCARVTVCVFEGTRFWWFQWEAKRNSPIFRGALKKDRPTSCF